MNTREIVDGWLEQTLVVDFSRMDVYSADKELLWSAPGRIHYCDGKWVAELRPEFRSNELQEHVFSRLDKHVVGEYVPEHSLLSFVGVDEHGNSWRIDRVGLLGANCSRTFGSDVVPVHSTKITHTFGHISVKNNQENQISSNVIVFPLDEDENLFLPYTEKTIDRDTGKSKYIQTVSDLQIGTHVLRVILENNNLFFYIDRGCDIDQVSERLQSALVFLLGRQIKPACEIRTAIQTNVDLYHESWCWRRHRGLYVPLANPGRFDDVLGFWRALQLYVQNPEESRTRVMNTLDDIWWNTAAAAKTTQWAKNLVMAVFIEAMAAVTGVNVGVSREPTNAENRIQNLVQSDPLLEELKDPIRGWIAHRTRTAGKTVKDMVDCGQISNEHYRVWRKVRNASAHGIAYSNSNAEVVGYGHVLIDAMYRITLSQIGYSGKRRNMLKPGWPVEDFVVESNA